MFINLITIGWGWLLPFGGISERVSRVGNELQMEVGVQFFPRLTLIQVKWININGKGNVIDLYQLTYGGEVKCYRGVYFFAGLGGYYLFGNIGGEKTSSYGVVSSYGIKFTPSPIFFHLGYCTVPQGLNVGVHIKLR